MNINGFLLIIIYIGIVINSRCSFTYLQSKQHIQYKQHHTTTRYNLYTNQLMLNYNVPKMMFCTNTVNYFSSKYNAFRTNISCPM